MRHLLKIVPLILAFFVAVVLLQMYGNQDLLIAFLSLSISLPVIYLLIERFLQKNQLLRMKEEALRAELALLKNQINPHFFFNTLNNLYGLAESKSDLAPQLILKLSDLMRFTIYEGKKERVFLRDEIAYLENYLAIQRIRIKMEKLELVFEKTIADDLVRVPPLMFIMLVENAIKHGVGSLTDGAFIHIHLRADADSVHFRVENNFEAGDSHPPGIGLANLKRRLALLFPGKHQLETKVEDGVYRVTLDLELY